MLEFGEAVGAEAGLQRAVLGHVARIDSRSLGDYSPHRASTSVRREAALQSDARTSARG
jgi:hypothetical protein